MTDPNLERNQNIVERADRGEPYTFIAKDYGVSRQRVQQICRERGVSPRDGPEYLRQAYASKVLVSPSQKWDKERVLEPLKELATELGRTPTVNEVISDCPISHTQFYKYYGSYRNACEAAGLKSYSRGAPGHRR